MQKTLALLTVACLSATMSAQTQKQQKLTIPGKVPSQAEKLLTIEGSSDWHSTSADPKALLARSDSFLAHLQGVSAQTRYVFDMGKDIGFGVALGDVAVVTPTKFRANFGEITFKKEQYGIHRSDLVADGKHFQKIVLDGWTNPRLANQSRLPKPLLPAWSENYQQLIFAALGTGDKPLSTLYTEARRAGMKVYAQERKLPSIKEYRVVISGVASLYGVKTRLETEVLIDAGSGAILKLTQLRRVNGDTPHEFKSYWAVKWNRSPGQIFDPTLFTVTAHGIGRKS